MVFNPHFRYFFSGSPDVRDSELGSIQSWPAESLLLLDSFEPTHRAQILVQASNHRGVVWILRQDQNSVTAASDLESLRRYQSRLVALLPRRAWFYTPCHAGRIRVWILDLPDSPLYYGK